MKDATSTGFRLLDFDDETSGLLAYALDEGTLLDQDAAPLWQRFKDAAAKGAKIRIYAEYHGTPKVSGGLVLAKLKTLGSILATMERMALVGDKAWMGLYEKVINPITQCEIRHFSTEERDAALAWLRA